jgi:hypothetical protein
VEFIGGSVLVRAYRRDEPLAEVGPVPAEVAYRPVS